MTEGPTMVHITDGQYLGGSEKNKKSDAELIAAARDKFLTEIVSNDPSWGNGANYNNVAIWKQWDENSGLYRLKMVGTIHATPEVLAEVLYNSELRVLWDPVVTGVTELERTNDGIITLYIVTSLRIPGVKNRDFIHSRSIQCLEEDKYGMKCTKVIAIDVSSSSTKIPEKKDFIRGETLVSGGLIEAIQVMNPNTHQFEIACKFSTISHVDMRGSIPKTLANMVATKATSDWFTKLSKATELHKQGKLKKH